MSEHKLFDDIDESVSNIQDEIAEMAQGIYGKLKFNDLTPKKYKITTSKKMLQDMLNDTKLFLSTLRSKELVGIKSEVESFVGEINQYMYLLDFCLKEDLKRRISNKLNENFIRKTVNESIKKILNNI
jgi:hypothetical protein